MRKFIGRALEKVSRMDGEQVKALLFSLAAENERLETVMDSMTDGLMVCDSSHSLILYNKASERLLPLIGADILEKSLWLVIDDDQVSRFFRKVLEEDDRVTDKEFTLETKTGRRTVSVSLMPLVKEKKVHGSLVHIEDVTEKRGKEARLRRAENLASLTTLAAGVAHEIKNPLGSIGIHIQLMEKAMKGKKAIETQTIARYLGIVTEEIERLNRIVVDFLFAVRPMDIQMEYASLNRLVLDLINFMKFELEQGGILIDLDLDETLPELLIDPRYLKQALLNLVKNAMAAMPEGGSLSISTQCLESEARLSVKDTGVGIPEENLAKIFEPYFTTRENGSGLGLTLVFKIVKEHAGDISVRSKIGEGSEFIIALPLPMKEQRLIAYADREEKKV